MPPPKRVTRPAKTAASTVGRPSAYEPRFARMAYHAALLGAKDADLARLFDVAVSTLALWKTKHADFSDALKEGKDQADAAIAKSLYHRARGYSHKAVKIFCNPQGIVTEVPYVERYPPDTTAGIFWLKNRQPAAWRDRVEMAHSMSPEELRALPLATLQELREKAGK